MLTEGFPVGVAHRRGRRLTRTQEGRGVEIFNGPDEPESLTAAAFQFREAFDAKFDGYWLLDMCWCWSFCRLSTSQRFNIHQSVHPEINSRYSDDCLG